MRRTFAPIALAVLAATLTACGNAPTSPVQAAPSEATQSPAVRDLTDLEIPNPPDPGMTQAPAEPRNYDVDTMSAQDTYGLYYGYSGPWYSQLQYDRGITVLDQSVGGGSGKTWGAFLLARNDTLKDVGRITITATLLDGKGDQIGQASGTSPVPDVRPGEPVAVSLTSDVPIDQVASADYGAFAEAPSAVQRTLTVEQLQTAPYGDRAPLKTDWWTDTGQAPYPFVSLLFVKNVSKESLTNDHVLVAWFNKNGRVDMVSDATALTEGRTPEQLAYGQEFVVHEDDVTAADVMLNSQPMYWVWAE